MTARTVTADRTVQALMSTVLASLPASFAPASGAPDVQVIAGGAGWLPRAQELSSAGIDVIVVAPQPLPAGTTALPVGPEGGRILLDLPWAGNAALPHARPLLGAVEHEGGLLEVHAVSDEATDPGAALLDIALTLRALGTPLEALRVLHADRAGAHLRARTADLDVSVALDRTVHGDCELRLRLIGRSSTVEITLPDPSTARPAVVVSTDAHGSTRSPTLWESSHRTTWRRLAGLGEAEPSVTPEDLVHAQGPLAGVLQALRA